MYNMLNVCLGIKATDKRDNFTTLCRYCILLHRPPLGWFHTATPSVTLPPDLLRRSDSTPPETIRPTIVFHCAPPRTL